MIINLKALEELGYTVQIDEEAMQVEIEGSVGPSYPRGLGGIVRDCVRDIRDNRGWTDRQADSLYDVIAEQITRADIDSIIR